MLNEFKAFIMRGNLLELAVAFIMGLAFAGVVDSFTNDVVMAFIGAIVGEPNFGALDFSIGDGVIRYGLFINAVINFLIVATVLFLIVKALNKVLEARRAGTEPEAEPLTAEGQLLTEIRDLLAQRQGQL